MKQKVVVIGAGFAGMWAALSAARMADLHGREDIDVVVLAPRPELVVRPRLYEAAPGKLSAPLSPLFDVAGVKFISGRVQQIDSLAREITYLDQHGAAATLAFDKLVLASGSALNHSAVAGAAEFGFDVDQQHSAEKFDRHLHALADQTESEARNTFVICGGGLTGIELATELPARVTALFGADTPIRVIVIERGSHPGANFSAEMAATIAEASKVLEVEWRVNSSVESVTAQGVLLMDGSFIASQTVVLTAGVNASPLTQQIEATRDARQRLHVDDRLQVIGQKDVYATGDVARAVCDEEGRLALMTCQHAIPMGKFAGNNAMAALIGAEPLAYRQPNYVTCVDLGAWGAVYTETWEQQVKSVQAEGKKIKLAITNELIYPPVADREKAFTQADPLAPFV